MFLDIPQPWDAIEASKTALKVSSRLVFIVCTCTYDVVYPLRPAAVDCAVFHRVLNRYSKPVSNWSNTAFVVRS